MRTPTVREVAVSSRNRVVVKVGSSTLTGADGRVDRDFLRDLVSQIVRLREARTQVVLVSSGAIAAGLERLGLTSRPDDMPSLQAAASVGQVAIIRTYEELFAERGVPIGQVLLTRHDTAHRQSYLNARHTLQRLLDMDIVPVINENDTTAVDEIRFGDNDSLAALIAVMCGADLVVLLSDIEGLFSADPRLVESAELVQRVEELTEDLVAAAGGAGSAVGTGGMATKLEAARVLMKAGVPMVVCDGRRKDVVIDAAEGRPVGTYFAGGYSSVNGRKLWMAFSRKPSGAVVVDDGARVALLERGGSLLPAGVVGVRGRFSAGDVVLVKDGEGRDIARGLTSMSARDIERVKGMRTPAIAAVAPELGCEEVLHRDRLVIL